MTANQIGEQCHNCKWEKGGICMLTVACNFTPRDTAPPSARAVQVGGDHYKAMAIQPFEYITANGIGFAEGSVIKYVSRHRRKGGVEDLKKARHFLDLLIEFEEGAPGRDLS